MRKPKSKLLRSIKPNIGIRVWYKKQLESIIERMQRSVLYWGGAIYRKEQAKAIQKELDRLRKYWTSEFDEFSERIAEAFVKRTNTAVSNSLKKALAEVGVDISWKNNPALKNVLTSLKDTQVSLIKSIPDEQLDRVAGVLQRGLQNGQDRAQIIDDLKASFGVSERRARMIAVDQTNKATFAINRAASLSAGLNEGIWIHVAGRKTSRPTHVAMHHKRFFLNGDEAGLYDKEVGRRIMPGQLVNCCCTFRAVIPPLVPRNKQ